MSGLGVTPYDTLINIAAVLADGTFTLVSFSSRNATQTLAPITGLGDGGGTMGTWIQRDINGFALDLTHRQFRKYASDISCKDVNAPSFDNAWIGAFVTVECAVELSYLTGNSPQYAVVAGSSRVEGHQTFYRPIINMIVIDWNVSFDEWTHEYSWKLSLQEV